MRIHVIPLGVAVASFILAGALLFAADPWLALFSAGEGLVMLLVALRLRRRAPGSASPHPAPESPSPAPRLGIDLDEVDFSGVPEPVEACPHCGYLGIRAPTFSDGAVPGVAELSDARVCRRCGYRGVAAVFWTREEYRAFLKALAAPGA